MKRYEDIKARSRKADAEQQLINNEAELGRNLAELNVNGLKAGTRTVTGTVLDGDDIIFRVAVFEKDSLSDKEALVLLAKGCTFDEKVIILKEDSALLEIWGKSKRADD